MLHGHLSPHPPHRPFLTRWTRGGVLWALALLSLSSQALEVATWDRTQPGLKLWHSVPVLNSTRPEPSTTWRFDWWPNTSASTLTGHPEDYSGPLRWRLLGDYHVAPTLGLRVTGGLQTQLNTAQAGQPSTLGLRLGTPTLRTTPYMGLGYHRSGQSPDHWGGWSLAADMGLVATRGGPGLSLGHAVESVPNSAGEWLRELRFTPVLQLGASYAF